MKMSKQKVKLERSELLPKIALVAGEHLDGPITIEIPVLDNNFNYWYVGVGIKYNLSSLFKNNKKVRQAKLNMRKAQEEYSLAQEQNRERRPSQLCQFPDLIYRPSHTREKRGACQSELRRNQ